MGIFPDLCWKQEEVGLTHNKAERLSTDSLSLFRSSETVVLFEVSEILQLTRIIAPVLIHFHMGL
jgi:hypothetical protein